MKIQQWLIFTFLSLAGCASVYKAPSSTGTGALVLMTDFGVRDGAVSAMKGVAYSISKDIHVSDLTHEIPPFDIWTAAYRLQQSYSFWPAGTVFVTVVDPGVGSERYPIVARLHNGQFFVGPDNGYLTLLAPEIDQVRWIMEERHRRKGSEQSNTFHGRDLFVVVGAKLASGQIDFTEVGPVLLQKIVMLPYQEAMFKDGELFGLVPVLDPNYGNVWTNIPKDLFMRTFPGAKKFRVRISQKDKVVFDGIVPLESTFSAVPKGQPLLYFNSLMNLAIALNQDDFARKHRISAGLDTVMRVREVK